MIIYHSEIRTKSKTWYDRNLLVELVDSVAVLLDEVELPDDWLVGDEGVLPGELVESVEVLLDVE